MKELRTFESIGTGKCVVCGTSDKGTCFLVPIDGTADDGICEASPIHLGCLDLRNSREAGILYQRIK